MQKLFLVPFLLVLAISGFSLTENISREQANSCIQDAVAIYQVKDYNLVAEPHVANLVYIAPETALANGFVIPEKTILVAFFDLLDIEYFQIMRLEEFFFSFLLEKQKEKLWKPWGNTRERIVFTPVLAKMLVGENLSPIFSLRGGHRSPWNHSTFCAPILILPRNICTRQA